ncbi:Aspartate/glutamate/uridylate kinase [Suillus paluster]|uniref:Aspartate/glutamate/uridylate kinase n=1 Tax=Suillus paluster TaxID=48578 RepID=UPI001B8627CC|nr:Aspartate/glutamate/uridylate kinase [Suillus paluster]KAG1740515.1 Aspartate/glutamate/uridylate kinase [Suillus paluster]
MSGSELDLITLPSSSSTDPLVLRQNNTHPDAKWLIQKYGGTSVGKFAVNIARDIVSSYIDQHKIAVVCSARSGSVKALGTTNLLLKAASEARQRAKSFSGTGTMTPANAIFGGPSEPTPPMNGFSSSPPSLATDALTPLIVPQAGQTQPEFNVTVDLIRSEHISAAKASSEIDRDCDWLRSFLLAAQVIDEISPRSRDSIIGFGERIGCKLMTAVLRDRGIDAEFISLEDIIPVSEDSDSAPEGSLDQAFYDSVATAIGERIKRCMPRVPVVTGFFGPVPGSLLRQVGRGYTDLLSALLTVGLEASELQIWKEVDGIFTADPQKVPAARLIPTISPDEAAELTYYGSEVVHPFTMEQVIRRKIPIRVKNVENPLGGGTIIQPNPNVGAPHDNSLCEAPVATLQDLSLANDELCKSTRLPTAVTIKEHIVVLNVNSNRKNVSHSFLAVIFGTLDRFGVVVDLISTSEVHVSLAVEDNLSRTTMERLVMELRKSGTVSVHPEMVILSLVGRQMRNLVGISGRIFTSLGQGNVNIEMISQGASEINISCVIESRDAVKALNLIHQSCLQIEPEEPRARVVRVHTLPALWLPSAPNQTPLAEVLLNQEELKETLTGPRKRQDRCRTMAKEVQERSVPKETSRRLLRFSMHCRDKRSVWHGIVFDLASVCDSKKFTASSLPIVAAHEIGA